MNVELLRDRMKETLKHPRYLHSIGVEEVAGDLAVIYGYDPEKAGIAGILHDCAKNLSDEELLQYCRRFQLEVTEIEARCPFLLHGKVGASFAKEHFGIEDPEIISSIVYHTTGRPNMSLLEKIIFTADYIEPYRRPLPRITEIRAIAYTELDWAVLMILENTLIYLEQSKAAIDTMTVDTYEFYKKKLSVQHKPNGFQW
jgi:predicted HD superfamily hydrolase involved in NAD metabolism